MEGQLKCDFLHWLKTNFSVIFCTDGGTVLVWFSALLEGKLKFDFLHRLWGTKLVWFYGLMEWFLQPMKGQILTFPINVRTILELLSALSKIKALTKFHFKSTKIYLHWKLFGDFQLLILWKVDLAYTDFLSLTSSKPYHAVQS